LKGFLVLWAISTHRKNSATSIVEMKKPARAPTIDIPRVPMAPSMGKVLASQSSPANAPALVATTMDINARICATKMMARRTKVMAAPFTYDVRIITPKGAWPVIRDGKKKRAQRRA
jgi:hypothetical protein